MNKQNLIIIGILGLAATSAIAFFTANYIVEGNLQKISKQNAEQLENSQQKNNEVMNKVLQKLSKLEKQVSQQNEAIIPQTDNTQQNAKPHASQTVDTQKTDLLNKEIIALKQKMTEMSKKIQSGDNNAFLPDASSQENPDVTLQSRIEKYRQYAEQTRSNYENVFTTGEEDANWTTSIEDKIEKFITAGNLENKVKVRSVQCGDKLCKIILSDSGSDELKSGGLLAALGNVSAYSTKQDSDTSGQQETVLYITREGEDLPNFTTQD